MVTIPFSSSLPFPPCFIFMEICLQVSSGGQDHKLQAESGWAVAGQSSHNAGQCRVCNSTAGLSEGRARDANCISRFCSVNVRQEEAVQEKRREREMLRLNDQTKNAACQVPVSEFTGFESYLCKAFSIWCVSSSAHLSPLEEWGKRTRKLGKKTMDSLYVLHHDVSYCGYSATEGEI